MIAPPGNSVGAHLRVDGYCAALGGTVDESLIVRGVYSRDSGAAAMRALIAAHPDLDAVFAGNDLMAAGAIDVLQSLGKVVPDDIAVGGFDDNSAALSTTPAITTMRKPFTRLAREMTRLLMEQIDGEPPATVTLRTELVVRESA